MRVYYCATSPFCVQLCVSPLHTSRLTSNSRRKYELHDKLSTEQREITVRASAGQMVGVLVNILGHFAILVLKGLHALIKRTLTGTVQIVDMVLYILDPCIFLGKQYGKKGPNQQLPKKIQKNVHF